MRSAPAPDLLPIPGMNQGTAVAGGSGGSGSGDGNAGQGGDGEGANGGNGGNDAKGGANDASGCGAGTPGTCSQCGHNVTAGHPVDVVTGRAFTSPMVDLALPGPLPFEFARAYSAFASADDIGLGFGWNHSLAWSVEVRAKSIWVRTNRGTAEVFPPIAPGEAAMSRNGWLLERGPDGFVLDAKEPALREFAQSTGDGSLHHLTAMRDSNRNRISVSYDEQGRIALVTDSAGREVRFSRTPSGRIDSISAKNGGRWVAFATYRYSESGDLVSVTDADGFAWSFAYDEEHRLISESDPTGLTFHFRYDPRGRCVETWGDYLGRPDPSLASDVSAVLADGRTRAKGVHHVRLHYHADGYSEVVDSRAARRFFGNRFGSVDKGVDGGAVTTRTFDDRGNVLTRTDPMGAITRYVHDERGFLAGITDPIGRSLTLRRDGRGRIEEARDAAGGTWRLDRDGRGNIVSIRNPRGAIWQYEHDSRGLRIAETAPNGARTEYGYDAHGNVVQQVNPNGGVWRWAYNDVGNCVSRTDAAGGTTRSTYSDGGRIQLLEDASGGLTTMELDGVRQLVLQRDPDGRVIRYEWGGYRRHTATVHSNGDTVRKTYDREGDLVGQHNERGEVHLRTLDAGGQLVAEETFDGRALTYRYDQVGRLIRSTNGRGEPTELSYNAAGDLIARKLPDDSEETFEYNQRGDLVRAAGAGFEIVLGRDEVGNIVREVQTALGETHVVEVALDLSDRRVARRTSLGHVLEQALDAVGLPVESRFEDGHLVRHAHDLLGREVSRQLPGGAALRSEFDAVGRLVRRYVGTPVIAPTLPDQPPWVGPLPSGATALKAYRYSPGNDILATWDSVGLSTSYEYDVRQRLTRAATDGLPPETFQYDVTSNVHPAGAGQGRRDYGRGNRLSSSGDTRFVWDEDGRLVERASAKDPRPWRYEWDSRGMLSAIVRPDGLRVEYGYDCFGRRLWKRSKRPQGLGQDVSETSTRFVWDRDQLVHEIRRSATAAGNPVVAERTYWMSREVISAPLAHRDAEGGWIHYLTDVTGAPEDLVTGDGRVACHMTRTAYGVARAQPGAKVTTPLRFSGQYDDEEVGLVYNRYRYYDPELGLYVSADPVGLQGGLNPFAYCANPIGWVDPFGLHTVQAALYPPPPATGPGEPILNPNNPENPRNWPNTPGNRDLDSERHVLNSLQGRTDLEGKTLAMTGQCHSCPRCQAAMVQFAQDNKMRIMYSGGNGNSPMIFNADFRPGTTTPGDNSVDYEAARRAAVARASGRSR